MRPTPGSSEVDAEITNLQNILKSGAHPELLPHSIAVAVARLQAYSNRDLGRTVHATASQIDSSATQLAHVLDNFQKALSCRMKEFTDASDASSKALTGWTRVQAGATVVLSILTGALALAAIIQAIDIWRRWYPK